MAGYTRQDTSNNIANGKVIDADDFDAEYNALEAAFNATTGHSHDGTAGEGKPITKVGPSQDLVVSATALTPKATNTLDLGTSSIQYKNAYFDGTVDTDILVVSATATIGSTLGVTGVLTASGGLVGNVTGTVSNVSNHDTGDITEGSNLYYTDARARSAVSATGNLNYNTSTGVFSFTQGNTDTVSEGSSNLYYTTARATAAAKAAISVTDAGGDGSLTYSNGVITYTGASPSQVRTHFSGGTGVAISSGVISIGQAVATNSDVTFSNATISGNLTVNGTTTTVNSNTVNIGDNIITLNSDETGTPSQDAGITIERGTQANKSLVWTESTDKWGVGSETFVAGTFEGNVTGNLTGEVTGNASTATALATARNIALSGDVTGSASFNGTGNISISATVGNNSHTHTLANISDVSASASELNIMDGVTATTAELNIMDGVTATTGELNYVDGVTSNIQTQLNSKYVAATQATGTWQAGTGTTESLVSPAKIKAAIIALYSEASGPNFTTQVAISSSVTSAAHGLGAVPSRWEVKIVCTSTDLGYAVGDVICLTSHMEGNGLRGNTASVNATNIQIAGSSFFVITKTGSNILAITNTKWDLIFQCWK